MIPPFRNLFKLFLFTLLSSSPTSSLASSYLLLEEIPHVVEWSRHCHASTRVRRAAERKTGKTENVQLRTGRFPTGQKEENWLIGRKPWLTKI